MQQIERAIRELEDNDRRKFFERELEHERQRESKHKLNRQELRQLQEHYRNVQRAHARL